MNFLSEQFYLYPPVFLRQTLSQFTMIVLAILRSWQQQPMLSSLLVVSHYLLIPSLFLFKPLEVSAKAKWVIR